MIVVTVEMWQHGDPTKRRHLGTAKIANDLSGDEEIGNYRVTLSKWGRPNQVWKTGRIERFPRRALGPWDLLFLALRATVGGRNR